LEALREWRRVLRPGGVLALVTPNAVYPDPGHFHDETHANLFTAAALRSTLEEAGFHVAHLSALFPYLGRARPARSASIRLAWLARLPVLSGHARSLLAAAVRQRGE
jgi:SAM-dependent methyltransferase